MSTSCKLVHDSIVGALRMHEMKMQRRQSFLASDKIESGECSTSKEEDCEGSSSESTSTGLTIRPMSSSESTMGDVSLSSQQTNGDISCSTTFAYQMPQMHSKGSKVYQQPLIYSQQGQFPQGYNMPSAHNLETSFGYAPVQLQPIPINVSLVHQEQPQQVYPVHQYQQIPQDWVRVPVASTAVPCIRGQMSYPQQCNVESYQASSSVDSSTGSTPMLSFSTAGYGNAYGYFNTPIISSASCTPMQYPPVYTDVPPVLNLDTSTGGGNFPQRISCNINTVPVPPQCPQVAETLVSGCQTSNLNQLNVTADCCNPIKEHAKMTKRSSGETKEEENIWPGSCNYVAYCRNGSSNLFITWSGSKVELVEKLQSFKLQVQDVFGTCDENVWNVIFESHSIARKAFTMQCLIRLRIVPPKNSQRIWMRNPSPKFQVKFETRRRLVLRKGKAECHDIMGQLMKGCLICVDQLKGHRIRVVSCEGNFMFPGGKIMKMKGVTNKSAEKTSLGWISYRCKYTHESLVIRRSWNMLSDYIYSE